MCFSLICGPVTECQKKCFIVTFRLHKSKNSHHSKWNRRLHRVNKDVRKEQSTWRCELLLESWFRVPEDHFADPK